MRSLTLSIALLCAGLSTAHAQQFLLEAGTGTTLVGDTFFVQPGQNFTVRLKLDMQGTTANVTHVITSTAFGIGGSLSNRLSFISGIHDPAITSLLPSIPTLGNFSERNAALSMPGNYSTASGELPRVLQSAYYAPSVVPVSFQGSINLSEMTFTNSLSASETYGDASNETGLFLTHQIDNGSSSSLGASGFTGRRFGSPKYKVQAVPEPATITVALAGLAFLRARRKAA